MNKQIAWMICNYLSVMDNKLSNIVTREFEGPVEFLDCVQGKGSVKMGRAVSVLLKKSDELVKKAENELNKAGILKFKVMYYDDPIYPELLKEIYDPPLVLYYKGEIKRGYFDKSIAIVGSRDADSYGLQSSFSLAKHLARQGIAIISGLAKGVDSSAHKGVLEAGGRTAAILGNGIDRIYPAENKGLSESIIDSGGAVITEFPIGEKPERYNFPRRNRIISGLSNGTVVVEAASRSGSLITASFALDQGRDVFAVPGPLGSKMSRGCNRLIKQGAILIENYKDILDSLGWELKEDIAVSQVNTVREDSGEDLSDIERDILSRIEFEPVIVDRIIEETNFAVSNVESSLMMLEIKGFVKQLPGKRFIKV